MSLNLNYKPEAVVDTSGLSREEWLDYRKKGIGGSDAAAIMGVVSHFRALIEDMYHYKTYAPGSYLTGPSKEAKDFRLEIEDVILKNCHAMFVCGREVTGGMQVQITKAKVLNIPIYRVVEGKKGVIITMYVEQEKKYV